MKKTTWLDSIDAVDERERRPYPMPAPRTIKPGDLVAFELVCGQRRLLYFDGPKAWRLVIGEAATTFEKYSHAIQALQT